LGIGWTAAHSPQANGRVGGDFGTAQDRLVKGMRVAGVETIEQANEYLTDTYLVWWERELTAGATNPDDAHRPLEKVHDLAASLSHVKKRRCRLNVALGRQGVSDRASSSDGRVARRRRAHGAAAGRIGGSAPWQPVSAGGGVRRGEQVETCSPGERGQTS